MNANVIKLWFVVLGILLIAGCTSVTSRKLVGDQPVPLDPKVWNGAWTDDDETVLFLRVKDATNGVLEIAVPEMTDTEITLEKLDVHIRKTGDWWWASFKEKADDAYTFVRVSEPDHHLLAWSPDPAAFVSRIKAGLLKGELLKDAEGKESGSVILDELKPEHLRALESGEWRNGLPLDKPAMILRRLRSVPKP